MEKLQLISAVDFGHSSATADSGLYVGPITPGHYHLPWPLKVGQGILQGIEQAHAGLKFPVAIELSFMASGLGPWRPDANTYVDERIDRNESVQPNGYIRLGMQWHGKILQRTELTGMAINAYNTVIDAAPINGTKSSGRDFASLLEIDYFFGGLIATGVGPQPLSMKHTIGRFDHAVGAWMKLYRLFGHMQEDAIQTLHYDSACCHVQGLCEWVVCEDIVAVGLAGGSIGMPVVGLYAGSHNHAAIPDWIATPGQEAQNATTTALLVFKAFGVANVTVSVGSATQRSLHVTFLSPGNTTLALSGEFWRLEQGEKMQLTIHNEDGHVVSIETLPPAQGWEGTSWLTRPTYVFEKVKKPLRSVAKTDDHDLANGSSSLPPGCQAQLDEFCSSVSANGAACILPQRKQFGRSMEPYFARFDRSSPTNPGKAWRCYSHEALSANGSQWSPLAKTPSAFCSEGGAILQHISTCGVTPPTPPGPPAPVVCKKQMHDDAAEIDGAHEQHTPHPALQLHVVAGGADAVDATTADGSAGRPFTTLVAARDALRSRQPLPAGGAIVNIACGLHTSLRLGSADSGTKAAPIVWSGATDDHGRPCALISAGLAVPSAAFKPWSARQNVVVANLTALGMSSFGAITGGDLEDCQNHKAELFYGGKPMALARWPNNPANSSSGQTWSRALNGTGEAGLVIDPACPALVHKWADAPDGWIHRYAHSELIRVADLVFPKSDLVCSVATCTSIGGTPTLV